MSARNSKRPDGLSQVALAVWRHLRDQGGWHRPFEVAQEVIAPLLPPGESAQRVNCAAGASLAALHRRGHITTHALGSQDRPRYGVTGRCNPPEGESMVPSELAVCVDEEGLIHD
jgi:hypothetical protein